MEITTSTESETRPALQCEKPIDSKHILSWIKESPYR